jgi:hypothetical protein
MINNNLCYQKINSTSLFINDYFKSSIEKHDWQVYRGWNATAMPTEETINKEPVLKALDEKFKIAHFGILRMEPNRFYKWHVDGERGASINMLLNCDAYSYCLFGDPNYENITQTEFIKLEYQPNTFYIFNTQWPHCVINFDKPRYLFTVMFEQTKESLSYNDIANWALSNNI